MFTKSAENVKYKRKEHNSIHNIEPDSEIKKAKQKPAKRFFLFMEAAEISLKMLLQIM